MKPSETSTPSYSLSPRGGTGVLSETLQTTIDYQPGFSSTSRSSGHIDVDSR